MQFTTSFKVGDNKVYMYICMWVWMHLHVGMLECEDMFINVYESIYVYICI
jgi:hypothetical protein